MRRGRDSFLRYWLLLGLAAALLGAACSKSPASPAGDAASDRGVPGGDGADRGAADPCARSGSGTVVKLKTDDGLTLEADFYAAGKERATAAVLLHMVPPANDRSNFPGVFIDALTANGINVLNVDRRGAGQSEGVAQEAYQGPNGKLDAKAAFDFLREHTCPSDADRVTFVGASNGTTTALDFTVYAKEEPAVAVPAALIFLTGGTYTEAQTRIADHVLWLAKVPIMYVFSTAERDWSISMQYYKPSSWVYREYEGGGHGTEVLTAKPRSIDEIVEFLGTKLAL